MQQAVSETDTSHEALVEVAGNRPQRVSHIQKATIIRNFRSATSTQASRSFASASCAKRVCEDKRCDRLVSDIDLGLLCDFVVKDPDVLATVPPPSFTDGPFAQALVDPAGVLQNKDGSLSLSLCPPCNSTLSRKKLPRFALANLNAVGDVSPELKDLALVEEMLVAWCRTKMYVIKLQDHRDDIELPTVQRGIKGHVVVFPQHPDEISDVMPPAINDIVTPICVLFCGSTSPTST